MKLSTLQNLIYSRTHKDHKGKRADGTKVISIMDDETGATVSTPIGALTEAQIYRKLRLLAHDHKHFPDGVRELISREISRQMVNRPVLLMEIPKVHRRAWDASTAGDWKAIVAAISAAIDDITPVIHTPQDKPVEQREPPAVGSDEHMDAHQYGTIESENPHAESGEASLAHAHFLEDGGA